MGKHTDHTVRDVDGLNSRSVIWRYSCGDTGVFHTATALVITDSANYPGYSYLCHGADFDALAGLWISFKSGYDHSYDLFSCGDLLL